MLFSGILERYRKKKEKRLIVRELILSLRIDERQRNLYLESLDILDEDGMQVLYERLYQFVESLEEKNIHNSKKTIDSVRQKESDEREKDARSFNILLDNV